MVADSVMASVFNPSSLLQLIWLASPALPIGGFSYSEVLESAVEWVGVATESAASDWLVDQLHLSLARADLPVLTQAIAAWRSGDLEAVKALNDWVLQTRESAELHLQTEQMGRSLATWLQGWHPDAAVCFEAALDETSPTYPVAFAFAVARTSATLHDGAQAFAFAWAENMVGAAVKAVPLGQSAGQRILARLMHAIPEAVTHALAKGRSERDGEPDHERQAFAPMLAILSARHETQYSRLFRS